MSYTASNPRPDLSNNKVSPLPVRIAPSPRHPDSYRSGPGKGRGQLSKMPKQGWVGKQSQVCRAGLAPLQKVAAGIHEQCDSSSATALNPQEAGLIGINHAASILPSSNFSKV